MPYDVAPETRGHVKVTLCPSNTLFVTLGAAGADVTGGIFAILEAFESSRVTRSELLRLMSRPAIVWWEVIETCNVGVDWSAVLRTESSVTLELEAVGSGLVELAEL